MKKYRDNLKAIIGIGHTYEEKLNEAGIVTFKQLIQATTAEIKEATEASPSMIRYWKAEAENRL